MKKIFAILFAICFMASVTSMALATPPGHNFGDPGYYQKINGAKAGKIKYFKNGHPGDPSEWRYLGPNDNPDCEGDCGGASAKMSLHSFAKEKDSGYVAKFGGEAGGKAKAKAIGEITGKLKIKTGEGHLEGSTESDAFADNEVGKYKGAGERGVWSSSAAGAFQSTNLEGYVEGKGKITASFSGTAKEKTNDYSNMSNKWGETSASASQVGKGGYTAEGTLKTKTGAEFGVNAMLDVFGNSYAESQKYWESGTDKSGDWNTKGLISWAGASTTATLTGNFSGDHGPKTNFEADYDAGYIARGEIELLSEMSKKGGSARASVVAGYCGSGGLNTTYTGSAAGMTQTQLTNYANGHGTNSYSAASVTVSSQSGPAGGLE